jgi:hypothetical protein
MFHYHLCLHSTRNSHQRCCHQTNLNLHQSLPMLPEKIS